MKPTIAIIFLLLFFACRERSETAAKSSRIAEGKMPAITSDKDQRVHLVYGDADKLMYTFSSDKGQSFSTPESVGLLPGLVASATRGPQIAATMDGVVIIAVNDSGNIFSYLKDRSGKWTKTARLNDVDTTDKEGFIALSSNNENNLFAIWTDLRGDHHNKIFGAGSTDGGRTWTKNILVYASPDGSVCECCKPSVVMKEKNVFVMFRNWLAGNRDLYLIRSSDGGDNFGQAEKLGDGRWPLNGCPMDGGSLVINKTGVAETVWRRESSIYTCEPGKSEKEIGEGKGCAIELVDGKNIYAWSNDGNIVCLLPDGSTRILGKGSLPILRSVSDDEVICVWENNAKIECTVVHI